ncbi:MAG TPA: pyridoxamine 5'-phosphate oxidase family protein [Tahibacter sp.]|nr:pyridoxamine 5'-phosphate oxidase family protein [Tahibacter sp.]
MSVHDHLIERSRLLLDTARFVTLSTIDAAGEPWASTVNYVARPAPLRLVWYSMREARHSVNIAAHPGVAASIFRTDLGEASPLGLDGAQLTGLCRAVPADELPDVSAHWYERNFPDPAVRADWMLPLTEFMGDGPRRFYELRVTGWWLFDFDRWQTDKVDSRIAVPLADLLA